MSNQKEASFITKLMWMLKNHKLSSSIIIASIVANIIMMILNRPIPMTKENSVPILAFSVMYILIACMIYIAINACYGGGFNEMKIDNTPKNKNNTKSDDSKIEKFSEGSSTIDNSNLEIIRNQTSTNDSTSSK